MNIDNITSDKMGLSVNGMQMQIKVYEQEIERLKELCDKYEEEHKTTFEIWQKDIKENKKLHSIIKEVRECIEDIKSKMIEQDKYYIDSDILLKILDKAEEE